jgi:hypothetical protein
MEFYWQAALSYSFEVSISKKVQVYAFLVEKMRQNVVIMFLEFDHDWSTETPIAC